MTKWIKNRIYALIHFLSENMRYEVSIFEHSCHGTNSDAIGGLKNTRDHRRLNPTNNYCSIANVTGRFSCRASKIANPWRTHNTRARARALGTNGYGGGGRGGGGSAREPKRTVRTAGRRGTTARARAYGNILLRRPRSLYDGRPRQSCPSTGAAAAVHGSAVVPDYPPSARRRRWDDPRSVVIRVCVRRRGREYYSARFAGRVCPPPWAVHRARTGSSRRRVDFTRSRATFVVGTTFPVVVCTFLFLFLSVFPRRADTFPHTRKSYW